MDRRAYALKHIDMSGIGLELGPLYSPLIKKSETNIFYVDHMSVEDLKIKYKDEPVPLDQLVPVDFVLDSRTLRETVDSKQFDYIVASHVIEHVPDTVRWFQELASVLKPGGIVSLVIPDKRFTFDITRNVSRPADIIGAYLDGHKQSPSSQMYEYSMEIRDKIDPQEVWENPNGDYTQKPFYYSNDVAYRRCVANTETDNYVDCHCHVFTPYDFIKIIRTLINLELFDFEIASFDETPANRLEFYTSLRKISKNKKQQLASLPNIETPVTERELHLKIASLQQQVDTITGSRSWKVTKPLRVIKNRLSN